MQSLLKMILFIIYKGSSSPLFVLSFILVALSIEALTWHGLSSSAIYISLSFILFIAEHFKQMYLLNRVKNRLLFIIPLILSTIGLTFLGIYLIIIGQSHNMPIVATLATIIAIILNRYLFEYKIE